MFLARVYNGVLEVRGLTEEYAVIDTRGAVSRTFRMNLPHGPSRATAAAREFRSSPSPSLSSNPLSRNRPCATASGAQQIQQIALLYATPPRSRAARHFSLSLSLLLHTTDFFSIPLLYPLMTVYGGNSWRAGNETSRKLVSDSRIQIFISPRDE